jgi:Xaa-Pro aminopeptidase
VARAADRAAKRERVLALLEGRGAEGLVLSSHAAVTWYLDGARTHVSLLGDPVAAVVVRPGGDEIRVFENEAERMLAEELHPDDAALVTPVPWHEPLLPAAAHDSGPTSGRAAGRGLLRESDVAAELRAARASLLPGELGRYRRLGAEVAEVLTEVAEVVTPASSEREAAAMLAGALVGRGIDPVVVLVSGAARVRHRHPLPTDGPLGERAMLVVCGRRHGLIANATRWVEWESAVTGSGGRAGAGAASGSRRSEPGATRAGSGGEADRGVLEVEAAFFDATVPGARVGEVFAAGAAAYASVGFDAEEWRRHHQGGPTGYAGRDPRASFGVEDVVQTNHAFAWNPSVPGAKVEDTVFVTATGIEPLTVDARWPVVEVAGRWRPVPLRR